MPGAGGSASNPHTTNAPLIIAISRTLGGNGGDDLDLDENALGKRLDRDGAARGKVLAEGLSVNAVECGEIIHVVHEAGSLNHMIEVGARSGKKRADVLHDLGRLLFDGGAYDLARGRIEGIWPEANSIPLTMTPWEYGPMAAGAFSVLIDCILFPPYAPIAHNIQGIILLRAPTPILWAQEQERSMTSTLTLDIFEEAAKKVKEVTQETKLVYSHHFSKETGNEIYLKPENMQRTGAYKVRGAYYKISTLTDEERERGLITASAGNHAQGVAYAARKYGVNATIVMPTTTPLIKVERTKEQGAEVVLAGGVYDEAYEHAMNLAEERG